MGVIAFVPARSGSKGIKNKNIKEFNSKPLIYWVLKALQDCNSVDQIYLATDGDEIATIATKFGFDKLSIFYRNPENASDSASTESVMLEFLQKKTIQSEDTFILVQATSPFTTAADFEQALVLFEKDASDSLLSVARQKRFYWSKDGSPINYNYKERPRRQDFEGTLLENGAFYISKVDTILKSKNRLSGEISLYEMPAYTSLELDEEEDWLIGEILMKKYHPDSLSVKGSKIELLLSDVDGVLTDAGMYYSEKGDEIKKFSTYDGMAFKLLKDAGIKVGIITSEDCDLNRRRAEKLKLDYHFHGIKNKLEVVESLIKEIGISIDQVAYIGDDLNDIEVLQKVGIAACPANAQKEVKSVAGIIHLGVAGGKGVVRCMYDRFFG
ncbi:HAD-IIIA family hydrolase [Sunxiuqinia sp. A32]|uniref:HAD-IIIA family hydrolase n=1 Tax=Sunxiuqinia sp. A32 TaxID=3461496 RepID=UPI0040454591